MTNILYLDSDNAQNIDSCKLQLKNILSKLGDIHTLNLDTDPLLCEQISNRIKNYDGVVVIWNNLKPLSLWVIDICKRFNKNYAIVERGIVPTQLENNYGFYAGGIGFECANIDPKYFNPTTYPSNIKIIKDYYDSNNLYKTPSKDKVVFVGQLSFDSTMTHFSNTTSYANLIKTYLEQHKIDASSTDVVFCPHPRDDKNKYKDFGYRLSDRKTILECLDAKLVVCVSSTIIYELYGLEITTDIIGFGHKQFPTKRHWKNHLHCLSTALDCHFDTTTTPEALLAKLNLCISINNKL